MSNIVGVKFRKPGKIYFFDANGLKIDKNKKVIAETALGDEFGTVVICSKKINPEKKFGDLKKIIRIASKEDIQNYEFYKSKERDAFKICEEKIKKHKLNTHLSEVEYKFDGSKILFYFTAEGRIDFRDLVKDLASIFKSLGGNK